MRTACCKPWPSRGAIPIAALCSLSVGCGSDGRNGPVEPELVTGSLQITAVTTGQNLDGDGYTVAVDSSAEKPLGVNAGISVEDLATGEHRVALGGLAANCTVDGENPRTAMVEAGRTTQVGFAIACTAQTGGVTVTALDPDTLVDGGTVTITGTGFNAVAANNTLTIDGVPATVTAATGTSVSATVPVFDCRPVRAADVTVTVGTATVSVRHPVRPAEFFTLGVGQQTILQDPATYCLQFAPSLTDEEYLIGVQSTSEAVTSLTPVRLTAMAATAAAAVRAQRPAVREPGTRRPPLSTGSDRTAALLANHRAAEARLRAWERRRFGAGTDAKIPTGQPIPAVQAIPADVAAGDTVPLRVPDILADDACATYTEITTVARVVGARGVWLEDITNPAGFTVADFQSLSDLFDRSIYAVDVAYFGAPTDLDGNGRVVVAVTNRLNQFATTPGSGTLGFVFSGDLFLRSSCASSDEGELFYGIAPDPAGQFAFGNLSAAQARRVYPFLIAHEFAHTIQQSRRTYVAQAPFMASWTAEGQATLAEEVVGHSVEGRSTGQNYGFEVAFNFDDPSSSDWYGNKFDDLVRYFGFATVTSKVVGAPEQCSLLERAPDNPGPCTGIRQIYLSWSFLRWISDHFGPSFPGGEQGLHQALVDDDEVGYVSVAEVVGQPIETLLAQWAAMLYVDDRIPNPVPELTLPSWNLFNIFDESLVESARLVPRSHGFENFVENIEVRAASSAYIRLSGAGRAGTALRARTSAGGPLPPVIQIFVVRLR